MFCFRLFVNRSKGLQIKHIPLMVKLYKVVVRNGIWYRVPRHLVEPKSLSPTAFMAFRPLAVPDPGNRLKLPWYVHH